MPWAPVKPWQMTLVSRSTRTDIRRPSDRGLDDLVGGVRQVVAAVIGSPIRQDLLAQIDVGALEADHQRHAQVDLARRGDDALGDHVAAHDAAEDVDQDALDLGVGEQHA